MVESRDDEVVSMAKRGRKWAVDELMAAAYDAAMLVKFLKAPEDRRDFVQGVVVESWKSFDRGGFTGTVKQWKYFVVGVARNQRLMWNRTARRLAKVPVVALEDLEETADHFLGVERSLAWGEYFGAAEPGFAAVEEEIDAPVVKDGRDEDMKRNASGNGCGIAAGTNVEVMEGRLWGRFGVVQQSPSRLVVLSMYNDCGELETRKVFPGSVEVVKAKGVEGAGSGVSGLGGGE